MLRERLTSRGWWRRRLFVAVAVLAAVVFLADCTSRAYAVARDVREAHGQLRSAQATLGPLVALNAATWPDIEAIRTATEDVGQAAVNLRDARSRLGYLRYGPWWFGWVPWIGGPISRMPAVLDTAAEVTDAADRTLVALDPLLGSDRPLAEAATAVFVDQGDALLDAMRDLDVARPDLQALAAENWPGPFSRVGDLLAGASEDLAPVPETIPIVEQLRLAIGPLLGLEEGHRLLILGQNEHEVRPTGGFIGTAGIIEVVDGEIVVSRYESSYAFDDPRPSGERRVPPDSVSRFLGIGEWHLRDSNFDADFPTSAQRAIQFLSEDAGESVTSVVAVDSELVALLLEVFGPIEAEGYPEPLTRANWFALVEEVLYADEQALRAVIAERDGTVNYVVNPSFEATAEGWFADGDRGEIVRVTSDGAVNGKYALKFSADGQSFASLARHVVLSTAGTYTLSATITAAGGPAPDVRVRLYNARDGGVESVPVTLEPAEGALQISVTQTITDVSQPVMVAIYPDFSGTSSARILVDAVQLERGSEVTAFVESYATELGRDRVLNRSTYLTVILDQLLGRVQGASGGEIAPLLRALQQAAAGRHLQAYSTDPAMQDFFAVAGVDGALHPEPGIDTIAVIDANVSYNKLGPAIEREIFVFRGSGGITEVHVTYRNVLNTFGGERYARLGQGGALWNPGRGAFDEASGVLGTGTQLIFPPGSRVLQTRGLERVGLRYLDSGAVVVDGFVAIPPGEERTGIVVMETSEPAPLLLLWKQGGSIATTLRVLENTPAGDQHTLYDGPFTEDVLLESASSQSHQ